MNYKNRNKNLDNTLLYFLLCSLVGLIKEDMGANLVIVESPAKAKTIEKFLGSEYTVKSSFGHIRDLSRKIWE
jgi:hypothetical protein